MVISELKIYSKFFSKYNYPISEHYFYSWGYYNSNDKKVKKIDSDVHLLADLDNPKRVISISNPHDGSRNWDKIYQGVSLKVLHYGNGTKCSTVADWYMDERKNYPNEQVIEHIENRQYKKQQKKKTMS